LLDELAGHPEADPFARRRSALDERLRADWIEGAFVWHKSLEHAFPRESFWWLYGRPKQPE
jgi:hypothetical protein